MSLDERAHAVKEIVATDNAPAAIGPYSQAIRFADMVFASGQIALDPETGELVGDTPADETRRVMENLKAVLRAAGVTLDDVVKTTIYLVDIAHYPEVNAAYAEFFPHRAPARATVAVSALPRGALVEIDAVAVTAARSPKR